MLKPKLLTIFLCVFSSLSYAEYLPLVDSCTELVSIYASRDEKRFLAAQTTSISESLRAGYCLGVLKQYEKSNYFNCHSNWYDRAKFISTYSLKKHRPSENELLRLSCEI